MPKRIGSPTPSHLAEGGATPGLSATLLPAQAGQALTLSLLTPVLPAVAIFFGGGVEGESIAQWLAVSPFLGLTIGGLGSGLAIGAAGLRLTVCIAAFGYALSGLIGLVASAKVLLLGGGFLLGASAALLTSGLSAVTAIVYQEPARRRFVAMQSATANILGVILALGGAAAAGRFGWRTPFSIYLLFGGVMLAATVACVRRAPRRSAIRGGTVRLVRRGWPIFLAGGATFLLATTQSTQLPFLLEQNGLTSATLRAIVVVCTLGAAVLGSLVYGITQARIPQPLIILFAGLAASSAWLMFGMWSHGLVLACIAAALLGLALGILVPVLYGGAMQVAPGEASGQAIGLLNAAVFLGSFANPLIAGPLRTVAGLSGMMFVLAALSLLVVLIAMFWMREKPAMAMQS